MTRHVRSVLTRRWLVSGHNLNYTEAGELMGQGVVPDLLVSVDKLDLGWIRRWLSDYNDRKVVAP